MFFNRSERSTEVTTEKSHEKQKQVFSHPFLLKEQSEKCLQLALDYFGLESVPENNFNSSTNGLIYSFVPPASDSDKLSYIYIQDYWCDVKDVSIEFKQARVENGEIIFDIHWTNEGSDNIDIGPNFVVYKYDKPIQLEQKGIWNLNLEMLAGKGMTADDGFVFEHQRATSYNLSAHYDVLTPVSIALKRMEHGLSFR